MFNWWPNRSITSLMVADPDDPARARIADRLARLLRLAHLFGVDQADLEAAGGWGAQLAAPGDVYTVRQIAAMVGASPRTVRRHLECDEVPRSTIGGAIVVARTDLEDWLVRRRIDEAARIERDAASYRNPDF